MIKDHCKSFSSCVLWFIKHQMKNCYLMRKKVKAVKEKVREKC